MTIPEAIVELWESGGEPSDLNPWLNSSSILYDPNTDLDDTSEGVKHYLRVLSKAQVLLSNWKTGRNKPVRFRDFQVSRNVKLTQDNTTYTCTKISDHVIELTGLALNSYLLTDAVESSSCTISQSSLTYPEGIPTPVLTEDTLMAMFIEPMSTTSVRIHFREPMTVHEFTPTVTVKFLFDRFSVETGTVTADSPYLLLPDEFRNILNVTLADSSSVLKRAPDKTQLNNPDLSTGTPTMWYSIGKKIYFDVYFEEPTWFIVEYQRLPARLTSITNNFEIPEHWHEVLIIIGEYIAAKRQQQFDLIAVKYSHIDRLIGSLRLDSEEDHVRAKTGGVYVQREVN